jgi:hypothetical protein
MTREATFGGVKIANVANCQKDGGPPLVASVAYLEDLEVARQYIANMDFVLLKAKLMLNREEGGQGWSADEADKAEVKYKKWLFLKRKYPDELMPPPIDIDAIWHGHILETQAYQRDTLALFGKYLNHYPYFGMRGKADHEKLLEAFENTKRLYREEYGEDVTG